MTLEPWPEVPIGDFAREVTDQPIGDVEVLSVTKHRGFVPSLEYFGKQVFSKDISRYKLVSKGQFAYATIHLDEGSIDALEIRERGAISPMYTVFDVDGSRVDRRFLLELLRSNGMLRRYQEIGQGTVNRRKSIAFATLARERIPLPPLAEQKKIAAILSSVDEAIRANDAVIEQTRRVKEGLLQELLTRGIGHTEFRETEIGPLPVGWRVLPLENVSDKVTDGTHQSVKTTEFGDRRFLYVTAVKPGRILWDQASYIDEQTYTEISRGREPRRGSILYTAVGATLGQAAVVDSDEGFSFQRHVAIIYPRSNTALSDFVAYVLNSVWTRRWVWSRVTGNAQPSITLRELRRVPVPIPPIDEQLRIVARVKALDEALLAIEAEVAVLQRLKSGLLQDLLTGKVRVTP